MILTTENGEKKEAEIIVSFKIQEYDGDYIIYKVDNEYYGAKYINKDDKTELITDLSEKEKEIINKYYLEFQKESSSND